MTRRRCICAGYTRLGREPRGAANQVVVARAGELEARASLECVGDLHGERRRGGPLQREDLVFEATYKATRGAVGIPVSHLEGTT